MFHNFFFYVLTINIAFCFASIGDRSKHYTFCLRKCSTSNCTDSFLIKQPKYLQFLGWDCVEECKYECMWKTVESFQQDGLKVPQFYGKWPFVRIAGMQEPASVVFSVLNGATSVIGYFKYYYGIPSSTPMYHMVIMQLVISVNAWTWSAVFHWRDFPWTEKLDYFCATSLVIFSLYLVWYRLTLLYFSKSKTVVQAASSVLLLSVYFGHVTYLSVVKFDYGYNMAFNVVLGFLNCGLTTLLYCRYRKTLPHFWKPFAVAILTSIFLSFELLDFSPFFWTIDSHSVWHFCTIPLPLLFFSFAKDDALYLLYHFEDLKVKAL